MVLVAAIALIASVPGIRNELVQDDPELITRNTLIHDLGNWREIVTSSYWPASFEEDLYRPLTSLGLAVEYVLGGGSPMVFRAVSYLLYIGCSLAFLALAWRLLPGPVAVGAAALFAAHPVHVEAVALGVSQNEIAVGLLGALMVVRYLDRRRGSSGNLRIGDWLLLGALYVGACLMKENALVLPGLLIGADVLLVRGSAASRLKALLPGYGFLAGLAAAVLLLRIAILGHFDAPARADALVGMSVWGRALTMLQVVPQWLRLLIWPVHLQADYSPREIVSSTGFGAIEAAGAGLVLVAVCVAWMTRRRAPVASFGLLWTAIALLPVSNVIVPTGVVLAERTLFLPSMGFLLAVGGLVGAVWRSDTASGRSARYIVYWGTLACLIGLGVIRSAAREGDWRNPEIFLGRTARDAPRSWRAQGAFANVLYGLGQREAAVDLYQRAIALAPPEQAWRARNELAERYFGEGKYEMAIAQLRESQAAVPDKRQTWRDLILGYLALGEYPVAARLADSAIALGGSEELFGSLRATADSAFREKAPRGSIRIEIQPAPQ